MPLRNLVFVDSVASSYPIPPSPRRCLTGKLHNGSLLIEISDCLKPYPPPSGPLRAQSRRMSPARQSESTICGISFALGFDAISRFPTLFSPDALQARSSDRFVAYNSRTDPPCCRYVLRDALPAIAQLSFSSASCHPRLSHIAAFGVPAPSLRAAAPSRPLQIRGSAAG